MNHLRIFGFMLFMVALSPKPALSAYVVSPPDYQLSPPPSAPPAEPPRKTLEALIEDQKVEIHSAAKKSWLLSMDYFLVTGAFALGIGGDFLIQYAVENYCPTASPWVVTYTKDAVTRLVRFFLAFHGITKSAAYFKIKRETHLDALACLDHVAMFLNNARTLHQFQAFREIELEDLVTTGKSGPMSLYDVYTSFFRDFRVQDPDSIVKMRPDIFIRSIMYLIAIREPGPLTTIRIGMRFKVKVMSLRSFVYQLIPLLQKRDVGLMHAITPPSDPIYQDPTTHLPQEVYPGVPVKILDDLPIPPTALSTASEIIPTVTKDGRQATTA